MAHTRRKFHEALGNGKERAGYPLEQIQHLYNTERQARACNIKEEELTQYRRKHAAPILQSLGDWMKKAYMEVLPSNTIGKALEYSIKRWTVLSLYATDGRLHTDSKPVENSIRTVAVGRKNYLFTGSRSAAERAAIFYSLFATCKVHNVNPYNWLKDVMDKLACWPLVNIGDLLPPNCIRHNDEY